MTALRFQTEGRHQTFPASLRGNLTQNMFQLFQADAQYKALESKHTPH